VGSKKEKEANQTADIYDKYVRETIYGDLNLSGADVPATFVLYSDDGTLNTDNPPDLGHYTPPKAGTQVNQNGAKVNQPGSDLGAAGAQVNQSGAKVNQPGSDLGAAGAQVDQSDAKASQADDNHKAAGAQVDLSGKNASQADGNLKNATQTSNLLKLGRSTENTLGGTIIPGSAFGATINSTYNSPNAMITASSWRTAYIGSYKPDSKKEQIVSNTAKFNVSLIKGIYVITENKTGLKQRFLKIGSSDGTIKIRATPPGARFDIYEAVAD
jgi:hypothetical protein